MWYVISEKKEECRGDGCAFSVLYYWVKHVENLSDGYDACMPNDAKGTDWKLRQSRTFLSVVDVLYASTPCLPL
jgi:hypothetical protein